MSNLVHNIGQAVSRPVLSPDGQFVAVIVPELEIHVISAGACQSSRIIRRIILPKRTRSLLSNINNLRWSPEVIHPVEADGGGRTPASHLGSAVAWFLISTDDRVISLRADLRRTLEIGAAEDEFSSTSEILADYQMGNQYGKISFADFVSSHRHALLSFETGVQASIISLDRPHRDDVLNPKYPDSRSFSQSSDRRSFALLLRANGQDRVAVFSAREDVLENISTFAPGTADAQGLQWSPNGDPVLVVWDSASCGVKVFFFTAMGHSLKQLDLSYLSTLNSDPIGIVTLKWYIAGSSTILAAADGQKNIMLRRQDNRTMKLETIASFMHPESFDGSQYFLWQETLDGPRGFTQQRIAFDNGPHENGGDVDTILVNSNSTLICSKISSNPTSLWLWQPHSSQPSTVLIFRENVRQALWHPVNPHVLAVITVQREPRIYIWHDALKPPATAVIPVQSSRPGRWEGEWLWQKSAGRIPFMLSSPSAFQIGYLSEQDGEAQFDSVLERKAQIEEAEEEEDEDEGDGSLIETPSRSSRKAAAPQHLLHAISDELLFGQADSQRW